MSYKVIFVKTSLNYPFSLQTHTKIAPTDILTVQMDVKFFRNDANFFRMDRQMEQLINCFEWITNG